MQHHPICSITRPRWLWGSMARLSMSSMCHEESVCVLPFCITRRIRHDAVEPIGCRSLRAEGGSRNNGSMRLYLAPSTMRCLTARPEGRSACTYAGATPAMGKRAVGTTRSPNDCFRARTWTASSWNTTPRARGIFGRCGSCRVLGMITTKLRELEPVDDAKRRIEDASRYADLDRLCLSPLASAYTTDRRRSTIRSASLRT